jgi:hypothetical protein
LGVLASPTSCTESLSEIVGQSVGAVNPEVDQPEEIAVTSIKIGQKTINAGEKYGDLTMKSYSLHVEDYEVGGVTAIGKLKIYTESTIGKQTVQRNIDVPMTFSMTVDGDRGIIVSCSASGADLDETCKDLFGDRAGYKDGICTDLTGVELNSSILDGFTVPIYLDNLQSDLLIDNDGSGGTTTNFGSYKFKDMESNIHLLRYECKTLNVVKSSTNVDFKVYNTTMLFKIENINKTISAKCPTGSTLVDSDCSKMDMHDKCDGDPGFDFTKTKTDHAGSNPPYVSCQFVLTKHGAELDSVYCGGRATATCRLEIPTSETKRFCYLTIKSDPQ